MLHCSKNRSTFRTLISSLIELNEVVDRTVTRYNHQGLGREGPSCVDGASNTGKLGKQLQASDQ